MNQNYNMNGLSPPTAEAKIVYKRNMIYSIKYNYMYNIHNTVYSVYTVQSVKFVLILF